MSITNNLTPGMLHISPGSIHSWDPDRVFLFARWIRDLNLDLSDITYIVYDTVSHMGHFTVVKRDNGGKAIVQAGMVATRVVVLFDVPPPPPPSASSS